MPEECSFCIDLFNQSFALIMKRFYSRILDISKTDFSQIMANMQNFVNFKNGGTCIHR